MSKRIFAISYSRENVTDEELQNIADSISASLSGSDTDDVLIVLPDDYSFKRMSLEELISVRNSLDAVIQSVQEQEI